MLSAMSIRRALGALIAIAFCLSFLGASCGQKTLAILPGIVNDPSNLSLRREILAFGTSRMCGEVKKQSVPLRLQPDDPITGRFFPNACYAQELPNKNVLIQFGGSGYAWTNLTKRLSFEASGAVEYDIDFLMDGSTMYVYFRPKTTTAANFKSLVVEAPQAAAVGGMQIGGQSLSNSVGEQIVRGAIDKGFTVIRAADGSTEFGLGVVEKGARPSSPYKVSEQGLTIVANDRSEVHQDQRDYVGPVDVPKGAKLVLNLSVDGAPAVDLIVVPRALGEQWLQSYTTQVALTPPPSLPFIDEPVYAGAMVRRELSLPAGQYYLVLDNTSVAGRTAPTSYAHDDRAALVSFAIAIDD